MNLAAFVHETDLAYKRTFAESETRPWGTLFWNEANPTHYDANHADVFLPPADPVLAVREAVSFFREKRITPRFYVYDWEGNEPLLRHLREAGFQVERHECPVQRWSGRLAQAAEDGAVTVERVTADNFEEALDVECRIDEFGGAEVRREAFAQEFAHPAYRHYLLRCNGTPAAIACLFQAGRDVRVESVATLAEYRGRGLVGHLLRHIQQEFASLDADALWVLPVSEAAERVYQRAGFETVGSVWLGTAHLPD